MKKPLFIFLAFICNLNSCVDSNQSQKADKIYTNGKIYTVNEVQPWAEALAIKDGKFLRVGMNAEILALKGNETKVIDLEGRMVLPGLNDHHCHPMLDGYMRSKGDLPGTILNPTFDDIVNKIKEINSNLPGDTQWFISSGHTAGVWPKEKYNRQFLDEIIPNRPAYLEDETGHNALVNTKALEIAGLTKESPDPEGGVFERDTNGELTGFMIEFGAINIFKNNYLPKATLEARADGLKWAINLFNRYGYTGLGDADAYSDYPEVYAKVIADEKMTIHPTLYMHAVGFDGPEGIVSAEEIKNAFNAEKLPGVKLGAKIFSDGTAEGGTALLVDPYVGDSFGKEDASSGTRIDGPDYEGSITKGYRGNLTLEYDLMKKTVKDLHDNGIQIKVHAVGDGAVREMLNIFEEILTEDGNNRNRHQIDHLNLVHDDDLGRFHELDITAGPYPSIAHPLSYQTEVVKPVLGEERWFNTTLPLKSLLDNGARIAFKSDWASIPMWPFYGIQCAVTRQTPGTSGDVLNEDEIISIEEAIKAYTINGAYALQIDDASGSIEEGKFADMVIIDRNIFELPKTEIYLTEVLTTLFKGQVVFNKESDKIGMATRPSMEQYLTLVSKLDGCSVH